MGLGLTSASVETKSNISPWLIWRPRNNRVYGSVLRRSASFIVRERVSLPSLTDSERGSPLYLGGQIMEGLERRQPHA